jgi:hypothetical protein
MGFCKKPVDVLKILEGYPVAKSYISIELFSRDIEKPKFKL